MMATRLFALANKQTDKLFHVTACFPWLGALCYNNQLNGRYVDFRCIIATKMNFTLATTEEILGQFARRLRAQRLA
jgi:hypothetical protein